MSDLKNTDGHKYRGSIPVWACQSDTTHPVVLDLAMKAGLISEERVQELSSLPKGVKPVLDIEELCVILETYFGFENGMYEIHELEIQTTRLGKQVAGEYRYTGVERTDKAWCSTGLASRDAYEISRYGGVVNIEDKEYVTEINLDDISRGNGSNEDY